VYERDAITSHLEQHHSDPITRLPLRNDQLTPVYLLRARAAEYRESAAAACVDAASSQGCMEPVRALRITGTTLPALLKASPFACICYSLPCRAGHLSSMPGHLHVASVAVRMTETR
jgi:hypothetical protein